MSTLSRGGHHRGPTPHLTAGGQWVGQIICPLITSSQILVLVTLGHSSHQSWPLTCLCLLFIYKPSRYGKSGLSRVWLNQAVKPTSQKPVVLKITVYKLVGGHQGFPHGSVGKNPPAVQEMQEM